MLIGRITKEGNAGWSIECEIVGGFTQGRTRKEALANLAEVVELKGEPRWIRGDRDGRSVARLRCDRRARGRVGTRSACRRGSQVPTRGPWAHARRGRQEARFVERECVCGLRAGQAGAITIEVRRASSSRRPRGRTRRGHARGRAEAQGARDEVTPQRS